MELLLSILLALSAFGPVPPGDENRLANTRWTLVSFGEGAPAVEGYKVTLEFGSNGRATGNGGCNTYRADYTVSGAEVSLTRIISTKRACADEAANRQEVRYFTALDSARHFEIKGDRLEISYDGGRLCFARG